MLGTLLLALLPRHDLGRLEDGYRGYGYGLHGSYDFHMRLYKRVLGED
jgi:hypothetical protein